MQVYGNVATTPERKLGKISNRGYFEFRMAESLRTSPASAKDGAKREPTWYTVRIMEDKDPELQKGNFVRATGSLKTDSFIDKQGKPASSHVLICFDVLKIVKPSVLIEQANAREAQQPVAPTVQEPSLKPPMAPKLPDEQPVRAQERAPEPKQEAVETCESDWSTLYP